MIFQPYERDCRSALVAGIDEAGRGCLAGPVTVGFALFTQDFFHKEIPRELSFLDDSKKLSPKKRDLLFDSVKKYCRFYCTIHISSKIIDRIGINPATELAIHRSLLRAEKAGIFPGQIFIDGNYKFPSLDKYKPMKWQSVIKGDSTVFSVAAASILAKVSRDRRMIRMDKIFPGYELARHKGYGTMLHRKLIKQNGPLAMHRRSYSW